MFGTTALALLIFFTPGLTELVNKFATSVGLLTATFMIPVPLIYGVVADKLSAVSNQRSAKSSETLPNASDQRSGKLETGDWKLNSLVAVVTVAVMGVLLFEPFPIPRSARDQVVAYNGMQAFRRLLPAQVTLGERLRAMLPPGVTSIVVSPYPEANVIIEESPDTWITGGRDNRNLAFPGNERFYTEGITVEPWLDTADLAFLGEFGSTHIVTVPDTTRQAQLLLQPDRFNLIDQTAGYSIFEIQPDIQADADDDLFAQMNTLYKEAKNPRWGRDGFNLILPGDPDTWTPIAEAWQVRLEDTPEDERAKLGLAFSYTLAGADEDALVVWRDLYDEYPDVPLYADGLASTQKFVDATQDSTAPLMAALGSSIDGTRVYAARRLLTDTFVYRLSDEQLDQIIAVTEADAAAWERLANDPAEVRPRAALLMGRAKWATAVAWLQTIPYPELAPEDLTAQAAALLAQGDVDGAQAVLRPATDADSITANVYLHADRWLDNSAAQMYTLMTDDNTPRETSPLAIADTGRMYALLPTIMRGADEDTLTVTATYSNFRPYRAYPIHNWRIQVVSLDSSVIYAEENVPAAFDGILTRVETTIQLSDDVPELTPALVVIQPQYDNAVTTTPLTVPVVLNRPESATIPTDATASEYRFGDNIGLDGYEGAFEDGQLNVDLYWQTNAPLTENYQVFVHVVNAEGVQVGGGDSAPVNNLYPTSQWRDNTVILDPHTITFNEPLPPGDYTVRVGLYRLSDNGRLVVSPVDERVENDSLEVYTFTVGE